MVEHHTHPVEMTPSQHTPNVTLAAATGIALIATLGSLYAQYGMGLWPCDLCWYQRIFMYPLVVILGVAAVERRTTVYSIALPLSIFGGGIATYHSLLQRTTLNGGACTGLGCSTIQYELFGVLTLPNLALIAFALIVGLLYWSGTPNTDECH